MVSLGRRCVLSLITEDLPKPERSRDGKAVRPMFSSRSPPAPVKRGGELAVGSEPAALLCPAPQLPRARRGGLGSAQELLVLLGWSSGSTHHLQAVG